MAQVKFYAVASDATKSDENGIYFVTGGELYKGSSRFGLGRVTVDAEFNPSTSTKDGQARGDIVVTGTGAGWVFDGTSWISIGGDIGTITSAWQADISTWTASLASGTTGSYIEYIEQDATGKVTAHAAPFNTKVLEAVGNGSASGSGNGITVSVVTTSGSVTSVEVSASQISCDTVTAGTGNFTNLNVSNTATFSATTVSADTLTIGGSTVEQLADKQIAAIASHTETSTALGITVSVTTSAGSVSGVYVDATSFGNAMHFVGVVSVSASVPANPASGDIIVIGAATSEALPEIKTALGVSNDVVQGQEYIYDGTNWELIGDQNTYALNAYAPGTETVTAGATTLPAATHAIASKVDAIAAALSDFTYSSVTGGSSSSTVNGVTVEVVTAATTAAPTVTLTGVGTAASMDYSTAVANDSTLPTGAAVTTFVGSQITTSINALSADVSSSNQTGLTVSVVETSGVITGVQAELVWLDADGDPL